MERQYQPVQLNFVRSDFPIKHSHTLGRALNV